MAGRDWRIEAKYVEYCSCDMGCPCESMADPTYGHCTGLVAFRVDKGHCEGVQLDDLAVVGTFYFPRAIHHGRAPLKANVIHPDPCRPPVIRDRTGIGIRPKRRIRHPIKPIRPIAPIAVVRRPIGRIMGPEIKIVLPSERIRVGPTGIAPIPV